MANRYLPLGGKEASLIVHFQCLACRHSWGSQHLGPAEGRAWLETHGSELSALESTAALIQRLRAALQNASDAWKPGEDVAGVVAAAGDWLAGHPTRGRFLTEVEWRRLMALIESDLGWRDRVLLDFLRDEDKWLAEDAN